MSDYVRRVPAVGGAGASTSAREFLSLAAAAARAQRDPARDWDGFVEALWHQVAAGFALTDDIEDYPEVPRAWFDHPDDPPVVAWGAEDEPPPS